MEFLLKMFSLAVRSHALHRFLLFQPVLACRSPIYTSPAAITSAIGPDVRLLGVARIPDNTRTALRTRKVQRLPSVRPTRPAHLLRTPLSPAEPARHEKLTLTRCSRTPSMKQNPTTQTTRTRTTSRPRASLPSPPSASSDTTTGTQTRTPTSTLTTTSRASARIGSASSARRPARRRRQGTTRRRMSRSSQSGYRTPAGGGRGA